MALLAVTAAVTVKAATISLNVSIEAIKVVDVMYENGATFSSFRITSALVFAG